MGHKANRRVRVTAARAKNEVSGNRDISSGPRAQAMRLGSPTVIAEFLLLCPIRPTEDRARPRAIDAWHFAVLFTAESLSAARPLRKQTLRFRGVQHQLIQVGTLFSARLGYRTSDTSKPPRIANHWRSFEARF